ncbi:sugar transferase [Geobacter pelophilus]|uniref:Sugar transferase n=1 Tax=Geoanaerobacter pelophilus TaxID=60036 RepID=A0AAW4L4N2_9BACT|nr:sugar transferase [Geoanaerobacter pelophilus]MBT0663009.1 sugar transferase [Geoanaerobacter pelophilus]
MTCFPAYKFVLLACDILCVILAFCLAGVVSNNTVTVWGIVALIFYMVILVVFLQYNDLYKINIFLKRFAGFILLVKTLTFSYLVIVFFDFISGLHVITYRRLTFILFTGSLASILVAYRVLCLPVVFKYISHISNACQRILIVGTGKTAQNFLMALLKRDDLGISIAGFIDDNQPTGKKILKGYSVLGESCGLYQIAGDYGVNEIIIAQDELSEDSLVHLTSVAKATGAQVRVLSSVFNFLTDKIVTEQYTHHPTVTLTAGLDSLITSVYQRIADIIFSLVGMVVLSPLLIVLSVIIKTTSSGPVFFAQNRVGKDGKHFKMLKFRSMYCSDGDDEKRKVMMMEFIKKGQKANGDNKIVDDSRITPIGAFIRKYSIDELPQLFNVLKGDMSLVGPRPTLPYEYDSYKLWHRERHRVLPGCTGFWQVYGRGNATFDEMVIMDLYMIENMSPWFYMQLLLKTFPVLLFARGGK